MGKERFKKGLDEIDFELIRELELDARQSYEELANGLGTSPSTVGRRLQRLSEKRIIDIVTVPNALALGYKTRVTFAINAHPGKTDEVAKMVSGYPNVQHVIVTIGRYDMIVLAVFQDQQRLFSFVTTELGNISGLANVETLMSLKLAKSSWVYLSDADYRFEEQNYYDLDYFDLKLIKALEDNPRCRITNLASQIGMSRPTTHHRLQNLIGAGVLSLVCVTDPAALGFETRVGIMVKTHPGRLAAAAEEMAKDRNIHHVLICTGYFDILAWGVFRTSTEMADFVRRRLVGVQGVLRYEVLLQTAVPKRSFSLPTPFGL